MKDKEARENIKVLESRMIEAGKATDRNLDLLRREISHNSDILHRNIEFCCKRASKFDDTVYALNKFENNFNSLMTHLGLEFEDIKPGIRVREK